VVNDRNLVKMESASVVLKTMSVWEKLGQFQEIESPEASG
jgi:hypothetical protein